MIGVCAREGYDSVDEYLFRQKECLSCPMISIPINNPTIDNWPNGHDIVHAWSYGSQKSL